MAVDHRIYPLDSDVSLVALLVTPARLVITKIDHGPSNEGEMVTSFPEADNCSCQAQDDHSLSFTNMNCSMDQSSDTADTGISDAKPKV